MPTFGRTSKQRLQGVHPALVEWAWQVVDIMDCSVVYGVRTIAEQSHMVTIGASQTMRSYHLVQADGYGHAIDLAPYPIDWKDLYRFYELGGVGLAVAHQFDLPLTWGGHWKNFIDLPHWQLPRNYGTVLEA